MVEPPGAVPLMKRGRANQMCYGILAVLAVALFHIGAILLTAYLCFFRADFINRECEKHQVLSQLGISRDELHQVTEEMISYVKGYGNSLDVTVTVNGNTVQFFNERDRQHLADIAGMVKQGKIAFALGILCVAGALSLLICKRKWRLLCMVYLFSLCMILGAFLLAGAWILIDLQGFINAFHRAFFHNDRWILNPAKDKLILLFPQALFRDGAVILASWMAGLHLVTAVAVWKKNHTKKR